MSDKSYVTIGICPICGGDLNLLLLDRRLKERFEMKIMVPTEVCDKCKKDYLTKGVLIINPETGRLVVLRDSAFKRLMNIPIPKTKICFAHDDVLDMLQEKHE
jgi:C4-type Zn-finger protein